MTLPPTPPTPGPWRKSVFADVCSDDQRRRSVGDRWSLSDEQIDSLRMLVDEHSDLLRERDELRELVARMRNTLAGSLSVGYSFPGLRNKAESVIAEAALSDSPKKEP